LDLGTNTCRLLIARTTPDGFRVIDAFSRIVRLGEGLGTNERLSGPAMARALGALRVCGTKIHRRGVIATRAVATAACRRAANCGTFLAEVDRETGIDLEIISSVEEGRLAIAGCAALLDPRIPYALVFDIGGGSTEVMWMRLDGDGRPNLLDQVSLHHGVITLVEHFGGDRVSGATFQAMVAAISPELETFAHRNGIRALLATGQAQTLGTSGTVTTLAGLDLGLTRYQRARVDGRSLSLARIQALTRDLLALGFEERAAIPCIGAERADLIIGGCAIVAALADALPFQTLLVADRGLREGILADFMLALGPAGRPLGPTRGLAHGQAGGRDHDGTNRRLR